jgi:hypothetical protein
MGADRVCAALDRLAFERLFAVRDGLCQATSREREARTVDQQTRTSLGDATLVERALDGLEGGFDLRERSRQLDLGA